MTRCLPGERDDLQVDQVRTFLAHFQHGLERREVRVGDVDVGAHMLDAVGGQGLDRFLARVLVSAWVMVALRSPQHSMPSNRVPLMFQRGSPAVSVASRWIWGSTKGGITRLPAASWSSAAAVVVPDWGDAGDPAMFQVQIMQAFTVAQAGVDDVHGQVPLG